MLEFSTINVTASPIGNLNLPILGNAPSNFSFQISTNVAYGPPLTFGGQNRAPGAAQKDSTPYSLLAGNEAFRLTEKRSDGSRGRGGLAADDKFAGGEETAAHGRLYSVADPRYSDALNATPIPGYEPEMGGGELAAMVFGVFTPGGQARAAGALAGEAGRFADLAAKAVKGDKLTPHHMPQAAAGFTSRADGGALMLPEAEHVLTRTYGFKGALTAQRESGMFFRDVLARDIRDVRNIGGSKYNSGLLDLLKYYRTSYPELMKK